MPKIADLLELDRPGNFPEIVAIIGSGGKSALLWRLCASARALKVLAGTTVKIYPPAPGLVDFFYDPAAAATLGRAESGVALAASGPDAQGKLGPLPLEILERAYPFFDKIFLEADGSRGLPFKGWAEHEPVVPDFVTSTIVVMPMLPGCRADAGSVHRLPAFLRISGAGEGAEIRPEHLAAAIVHPDGALKKARGRISVFLNQVENREALNMARAVHCLLPPEIRKKFDKVLAGSARRDEALAL